MSETLAYENGCSTYAEHPDVTESTQKFVSGNAQ